jgi:hypothetical protein
LCVYVRSKIPNVKKTKPNPTSKSKVKKKSTFKPEPTDYCMDIRKWKEKQQNRTKNQLATNNRQNTKRQEGNSNYLTWCNYDTWHKNNAHGEKNQEHTDAHTPNGFFLNVQVGFLVNLKTSGQRLRRLIIALLHVIRRVPTVPFLQIVMQTKDKFPSKSSPKLIV